MVIENLKKLIKQAHICGGVDEDCDTHKYSYNNFLKRPEVEELFIHIVSNSVKKESIKCSNCINCDLYENENTKPSSTYFCKLSDDKINDIEQHYCLDFITE